MMGERGVAHADVRHDAAAALRHAVHLAQFDVLSLFQRVFAQNAAREQRSLPAYAYDQNIHYLFLP